MKIIFCLPGASYSGRFLQCWTNLLAELPKHKITYGLSQHYMCNIYHVRAKCLGASIERGVNQKPFDGKVDYDYLMWIDSDMVFTPEDFFKLIEHDKDIVSGVYKMSDDVNYATVENMDEEFFEQWMYYPFLQDKDIKAKKGYRKQERNPLQSRLYWNGLDASSQRSHRKDEISLVLSTPVKMEKSPRMG